MRFHIVQITEINGKTFPDKGRIAAVVEIQGRKLHVEFIDSRYRSQLSQIFGESSFQWGFSLKRSDGSIMDVGLQKLDGDNPAVLQFLPAKLSMMGLAIMMAES